jgi:hypothetical protein
MTEPVRLYANQTAAPSTCGSCALFARERNDPHYLQYAPTHGDCYLKLPKWIKLQHTYAQHDDSGQEYVENSSGQWHRAEDTETCSFWRASGLTYVKDQTWTVQTQDEPRS